MSGRRCTTTGAAFLVAALLATSACQKTESDGTVVPGTGGVISITDGTGGATPDGTGGTTPTDGTGGSVTPGSGGAAMDAPVDVASGSGGAPPVDAGPLVDATPPPVDAPVEAAMPLTECDTPSIDRYQQWLVASEMTAMTQPAQGSILVKEDNHYVGKATFVSGKWHIISVWLGNVLDAQVDLTNATGFTLTYSATTTFYMQLRAASNYNTGEHFLVELGSTGGQTQTVFMSFAPDKWTSLPRLGTPKIAFADALKQVRAFTFVGDVANTVSFRSLRIDGYTPTCR